MDTTNTKSSIIAPKSSFVSPYRRKVSKSFNPENAVEQHHKELCCIDNILRRYDQTGLITHVNKAVAQYGDYTEVNEFQQSMNTVIKAQDAFMELPSHIREKFHNDPGEFFEFATNPKNKEAMCDLGLAEMPVEQVQKVEVINPEPQPVKEAE